MLLGTSVGADPPQAIFCGGKRVGAAGCEPSPAPSVRWVGVGCERSSFGCLCAGQIQRVYFGEIMGKSGWDVACWSDYSDTQLDITTWDLGGERDEFAISSEKPVPSVCSEEEVHSTKCAVGDEEESEPSKGKAKGNYKCEVCGVLHLKPSLLKQHMYSHSKDSSFVCPVENCGRRYKRLDHLNRHALTHKGNLFPCTWDGCDLSFNVNSNLQRHLKLHKKWGSTLRGSKKADAELTCPESGCGKTFKYPTLLQTHIDNVHDSLSITQAVCMESGCGEIFDTPSQLKIHSKVAHCFAFCETCGVSMLKTSLVAHARKHQGGQLLLRCPHPGCLHSYNKKSNLNTHIRAVHMNLKPYACSHAGCEMRFAYKSVRDKHEQCSTHATPVLEADFEAEDSEHRLKSRGGRKRLRLHNVDDLLPQKWRIKPLV